MAQLELAPRSKWSGTQTREQYRAIMLLRWKIFRNGFRRKGGAGEVVAYVILAPILLALALGVSVGSGFGAYFCFSTNHLQPLALILWGLFVLTQIINLNLGQPGTTFDPTQLIRFPLNLTSYVAIRLFFGLLSPGNLVMAAASLAVAIGVIVALPALWSYALLTMFIFAITNVLFTRMVFSWVDRWLSTRRAREVFTGLIFAFSIGIQYLNVTYNPGFQSGHQKSVSAAKIQAMADFYHRVMPMLSSLPPGLTANSLIAAHSGRLAAFVLHTLGCALFALAFLAIFAMRMRTEFRGENLSNQANAVAKQPVVRKHATELVASPALAHLENTPATTSTIITTLFGKELLYIRRNTGLFYGLIAPLLMVFLFAGKFAGRTHSPWVFPGAMAYALLGVVPVSFNAFGLDATGAQFYFLAPIRLRDVMLAKNVLNTALALFEIVAIFGLITYISGLPPTSVVVDTLLWAVATLALELTVGNYRSISSPKKIDPSRTTQKQASQMSALISIGILMASGGIGFSLVTLGETFHMAWAASLALLALAVGAAFTYRSNLENMDRYALAHRESMFEELCKKS